MTVEKGFEDSRWPWWKWTLVGLLAMFFVGLGFNKAFSLTHLERVSPMICGDLLSELKDVDSGKAIIHDVILDEEGIAYFMDKYGPNGEPPFEVTGVVVGSSTDLSVHRTAVLTRNSKGEDCLFALMTLSDQEMQEYLNGI